MEVTTTDLQDFGKIELAEARGLLNSYGAGNITELGKEFFRDEKVTIMFNRNSGYVFLTNEDYTVLMFNDEKLDLFLTSPYEGHEGFADELLNDYFQGMHPEDQEWLLQYLDEEQKAKAKELLGDNEERISELELSDY